MDFSVVQDAALAAFGVSVTLTRVGGTPTVVQAIFRARHQAVDPQSGALVLIDQPVLDVRLAEMPSGDIARNDAVTVGATNYVVTEVRKDGEGMAQCVMQWAT